MKVLVELGDGDFDPTAFLKAEIRPLAHVANRETKATPRIPVLPALVASGSALSLTELAREWHELKPRIEAAAIDEEADPLFARAQVIEDEFQSRRLQSPADAIAALEVARTDMVQFKFAGIAYSDDGDGGDHLALKAIDGALGVLRGLA